MEATFNTFILTNEMSTHSVLKLQTHDVFVKTICGNHYVLAAIQHIIEVVPVLCREQNAF